MHGLASLQLRWLVPTACGCVLLTALATVLLHANDPGLAQTKVDSRTVEVAPAVPTAVDARGARGAQGVGAGVADATGSALTSAHPRTPAARSPTATRVRTAAATPSQIARSLAVGDLTLALFGGDHDNPDVSYVLAVSASDTGPITLTYTFSGSKNRGATTTRTQVLSGQTEYAVAGSTPGRAFCGGTVTMRVTSFPQAANGTVTATTTQAC